MRKLNMAYKNNLRTFSVFLIFLTKLIFCDNFIQPLWNNKLDFQEIENRLKFEKISRVFQIKNSQEEVDLKTFYAKIKDCPYLVILQSGLKAVLKARFSCYAEAAAYEASKFLSLRLVPPTITRSINDEVVSLQLFIESNHNRSELKNLLNKINPKDKSDSEIFLYIFGQNDSKGINNKLIQIKNNKVNLALIDNELFSRIMKIKKNHNKIFYRSTLNSLEKINIFWLKKFWGDGYKNATEASKKDYYHVLFDLILKRRDRVLSLAQKRKKRIIDDLNNGKIAIDFLDNLLLNKNIKGSKKNKGRAEILDCVKNLEIESIKDILIDLPYIKKNYTDKFRPCNPSILKTDTGYYVICRAVNYFIDNNNYKPITGKHQSKNFFLEYDKNLNLIKQKEIVTDNIKELVKSTGLQDCRLFSYENELWIIAAQYINCDGHRSRQVLCKLNNQKDNSVTLDKYILLKIEKPNKHEKNWLPLVDQSNLHLIYFYDPFVILKADLSNENCSNFIESNIGLDFANFRGSCAPIKFDNGYLVMIHEVILLNNQRYYLHRFLFLDNNFKITKISRPFTFFHKGVEFCCSMALDHSNKKLIMSMGLEDQQAKICIADADYIKSLLIDTNNL